MNKYDSVLFPESFDKLIDTADLLSLDIYNSYLTLDSCVDSNINKELIIDFQLTPVIKPNPRNSSRETRYTKLDEFKKVEHIYKERYKAERTFAWKSKYRKSVIRYEILQCIHLGFRYIAYTMVNYRKIFNNPI